jgi:hypothetical protein
MEKDKRKSETTTSCNGNNAPLRELFVAGRYS